MLIARRRPVPWDCKWEQYYGKSHPANVNARLTAIVSAQLVSNLFHSTFFN